MSRASSPEVGGLSFRRQFVLGPSVPDLLTAWEHHPVGEGLVLSVHPDLPCWRADVDGRSLVLLGHVLDHRYPEWDDQTIVSGLLRDSRTLEEVIEAFAPLSGRWVAIHVEPDRTIVLHDAAALRQVHHGRDDEGALWCGSRPELLARVTGRRLDVEGMDSLQQAGVLDVGTVHFWPGTGSAFVGIERLLPNHHLDARTGEVQRYWPTAPVPALDLDTAVARCGEILTGVLAAASRRYPLALAVTAGHDTRLLLAAARGCIDQIPCYTLQKTGMTWLTADIRVPRKMLGDLGVRHRVIPVSAMSEDPVARTIAATFTPFHQQTADQAAALANDPPRPGGWVTVNGNVCEIARIPWISLGDLTPEKMADAVHMGSSDFAKEQLQRWYAEALPAIETSGMNPWEFFYWEQRLSGWAGTVRSEFDVVEEAVSPYNSRQLVETMLGVDLALRVPPDFVFFRRLIGSLWPELLDYPINPKSKLGHLEHRLRGRLKSTTYNHGARRRARQEAG